MARVLPGTAPHVVTRGQADVRPALAWIEAHADAFRGQWVAVRLVDPVLVASAPTLTHLWHMASPALLKDCKQNPQNSRRNTLPTDRIDWPL